MPITASQREMLFSSQNRRLVDRRAFSARDVRRKINVGGLFVVGGNSRRAARTPVLIVDDDSATRIILKAWLDKELYEVTLAEDGSEAWSLLEQQRRPKLILLDWAMPQMDGVALCRRLREARHDYYPYILMMTDRQEKGEVAEALQAGADDYLAKPFDNGDLQARLTVALRILERQDNLIQAREELRIQAMKDALTGLWSRTAFLELFERELDRAVRAKSQTGLLFLDLDHFKKINDTHGHLVGDRVLKEFAQRLRGQVRSYDFVGRYGGEEFCVALPDCNRDQLCNRAESIREAIAANPIHVPGCSVALTISIGATVAEPLQRRMLTFPFAVADLALYKAKSSGRNCTVHCEKAWTATSLSMKTPKAVCEECEFGTSRRCVVSADPAPASPLD
jgi:two-component system, cell cycle response regulator